MPLSGEKSKKSDIETKSPFGFEGDDWSCSWKRKRRRKDSGRKLPLGSKVEVRQFDAGLRGSWYTGVIIGYEKSSRIIEYDYLLAEDGSSKLIESVRVSAILEGLNDNGNPKYLRGRIRPSPPVFAYREFALCYGLCVDAFIDDAWWEGVIFDHQEYLVERLVFFPDQGDQHRVNAIRLRITQDWDEASGEWRCRGNWCFLELLEKFLLEGSLPVSVRQIWYDLRTSVDFKHEILEWTCGERSLWSKLVFEVVQENMNAALGLACTLKEVVAEDLTIQKSDEGSKVSKLQSYACGEDNGKQTHVRDEQRLCEDSDEQRLCEDMLEMTFKHATEDSTIQMNEGRKVRKLRSSACVEDTGKKIQVCDQQRLTENMLRMTVEHGAEDETIQMNEEGREVRKLQSSACGEDNGVCDQQRLTEDMLQMTVKHAAEDLTIQKSIDGRKDEELESSACGEDIGKQTQVCDQQRLTENMLQMTVRHTVEDSSIRESVEGREVEKLQSSACGEDTGKQTRVCDQQRLTESMLRMTVKRAAEESTMQKNEEGRKVWKLRSSACAEDIAKQTQVCDQQRSTEDMLQMTVKHAAEDLSIQKSEEGRKRKSETSAWGKDAGKQTQVYQRRWIGNMFQMTVKNVAEDLTIQENEEGREITELQSSARGEDTEKRTQTCDQQRLTENILQMNVAAVQHAIDLKPTDDIVLLEKDLQSEQITNTSEESGSASDFQSAGGKDKKLKAVRRGNKRGWVSKKGTCLGSVHNKLTSMRKKNLQALSDFLLSCQHDALGRTRSKVLSEAKQILLASGWVFGTIGYDSHRFYYDSPSGQRFHSFALACKAWQKEQEAEIAQSIIDDQADGAGTDNISPSPMEVSGHKMWKMMKGHWKPWGKELQPTYSPQAVKDYCAIYLEKKRISKSLLLNTKLHLLAMGWKIHYKERVVRKSDYKERAVHTSDYKEHAISFRTRYVSPCGKIHSELIKACMYLMQQDGKTRTKNNNENVSELHPKINAVSNGHCQHFSHSEKLKLREEEDYFSVLEPLGGSQDSRKAIQEDERIQRSANDHIIGDKVHHKLSDLSQDPVERVRQTERDNLHEEQASSALDSSSDNQESAHDGRRCMDASLSSTNLVEVTEGGSNTDAQKDLLPDIPVEQRDDEGNYSPLCQENFMMHAEQNDPQTVPSNLITATGGGSNSDVQQGLLRQIPAEQQDSEGNYYPLCRESFIVHAKQNDPQISIQCSKLGLMKRKNGKGQTVLSWLVDNSVVLLKQKVYYRSSDGHHVMAEGRITQEGIKCSCCKKVYGLAHFSVHAGGTIDKPTANIFLKNGKSLLQCQTQLVLGKKMKFLKPYQHRRVKCDHNSCKSDNICSVCHYGGELILCDYCPSSFHFSCIGLKGVPEGTWSCSSCQCGICSHSEYNADIEQFTDETILYCDQCERQYHVGCLRKIGRPNLESCPEGSWFCSERCSQIFVHLQKLMGRSKPTSVEGLSLTILRSRREDSHDVDIDTMVEHHSKLWVALNVLHECFQPFIEPRTKADFFANVVFNRGSKLKRLNFQGFYTMILEKEEEVISVATVRIFGEKVAEVPLIGTRVQYRRLGMCRILMNEIEKVLCNLGIKKLLLPAVPEMLATWINSFGFTKITIPARLKFLEFTFLDFEETAMCEKQLLKCATTRTMESKDDIQEHLLNGKVGTCEEPSVHSWDSNYCAGPRLLAKDCGQTKQNKMIPPVAKNVSRINRNNACGFAIVAPPVDMDKKRTTLGLKSYLTRAAARRRVAKTAS